jgi:nucleoside-diphosphate-sugar epimerase
VDKDETLLVTGASGFIGSKVVRNLLTYGFNRIRCVVRTAGKTQSLEALKTEFGTSKLEIMTGNLLSREVCAHATESVAAVYHLAAGVDKSFPGCFMNSVVTTRNLLDALLVKNTLKRFVNVSSLAVYSNEQLRRGDLLNESCIVEADLVQRFDAYAYGKAKQDELVREYGRTKGTPYVIVRPGIAFGPGKAKIPGRVGIDTFGVFLHLGLKNRVPLTYVDNCAEAIVLAGLMKGIEGQEINIIDDDLPRSSEFLRSYKKQVGWFTSIPVPYRVFYIFNYLWERYSVWSQGQLPPVFNRKSCAAYFKGNIYSNEKAKRLLSWHPRVRMSDGLERFFDYARMVKAGR